MERLILQYCVTYDYAATGTVTVPFVYSSKEEAMTDLKALVEAVIKKQKEVSAKDDEYMSELSKLFDKHRNLKTKNITYFKKDKDMETEKKLKTIESDITKVSLKRNELLNSSRRSWDGVLFGGQMVYPENFVSDNGNEFEPPEISTVDEFFKTVEGRLYPKPEI